ncbi:DUF72 domain-containing protein [Muricoccus radiodurans]|uniref:DUF72 domain-containing protein n=1 Tax=Muricoccus radiodurans TaxID=2231721 RepID=UPI003CE72AC5
MNTARIGTAGWSIPRQHAAAFPGDGTHLERYARQLPAVEINSSFYRPHRPATYARWAASVPSGFRFAVKLPRELTHTRRLAEPQEPLARFLGEAEAFGEALGPLLVQLPPSLRYDEAAADLFFDAVRGRFGGYVVCEPRHPTWFTEAAGARLTAFRIARVAADPAVVPRAAEPGGWPGLTYWRMHGSPKIYYSDYASEMIGMLAGRVRDAGRTAEECWCIFDNTALGEATGDALELRKQLVADGS